MLSCLIINQLWALGSGVWGLELGAWGLGLGAWYCQHKES